EIGEQGITGTAVTTTALAVTNIPGLAAAVGPGSYFIECWIPWVSGTSLKTWLFGFSTSSAPTMTAVNLSALIQGSAAVPSATSPLTSYGHYTTTTFASSMWTTPESNGTTIEGLV